VFAGQREAGCRKGSAMMKATDVVARAQDVLTVQRVFGAPIERNGLTVIPVARFAAGGGAGNGEGPDGADGQARGSGTGASSASDQKEESDG
jgi:uncharacterized spore protein YtfJ